MLVSKSISLDITFDVANLHSGQTSVNTASADEPSDFLARERAALGEDAAQFASPGDNLTSTVADAEEDDDDLLGGGSSAYVGTGGAPDTNGNTLDIDDMGDFETSFPAVDMANEGVGAGGTVTGSQLPYRGPSAADGGFTDYDEDDEPEVLRQWRESRDAAIAQRDERLVLP